MNDLKEKDIGKEKGRKITVSIGGISYQLVSQENEAYTREIAYKADNAIRQIIQQHPSLSTTQSMVLAVVNTVDALSKMNVLLDEAKNEVVNAENRAAKETEAMKSKLANAQQELFALRETDFEMKKELMRVSELNKQLELEIASLRRRESPDSIKSRVFEIDPENETWETAADFREADGDVEAIVPDSSEIQDDDSGIEYFGSPIPPEDLGDDSESFLEEISDSFAIPMDGNESVNQPVTDEAIDGYKQTSLEEYFA